MIQLLNVDRRKKLPMSTQLKLEFQRILLTHDFEAETALPDASLLAEQFDVSLDAVESIYQFLVKEKLILQRDDGFYTQPHINIALPVQDFRVLFNTIQALGLTPSIESLKQSVVDDLPKTEFTPKKNGNETYLYLKRLYRGDEKIIAMTEHYLPLSHWKDLEKMDIGSQVLVPFLHAHYQFHAYTERFVHSQLLSSEDALVFKHPQNSPILKAINLVYNDHGDLIEFTISKSLGELIQFTQVIQNPKENA